MSVRLFPKQFWPGKLLGKLGCLNSIWGKVSIRRSYFVLFWSFRQNVKPAVRTENLSSFDYTVKDVNCYMKFCLHSYTCKSLNIEFSFDFRMIWKWYTDPVIIIKISVNARIMNIFCRWFVVFEYFGLGTRSCDAITIKSKFKHTKILGYTYILEGAHFNFVQ